MTQHEFDEDINYFGKCEFLYKLKNRHLGIKQYAVIKPMINNEIKLEPNDPIRHLVVDHRPDAKYDFLHYQIGVFELRQMMEPVYDEDGVTVVGERELPRAQCKVFSLLGFGSTLSKARRMALRRIVG
jgi:hypothetical protein